MKTENLFELATREKFRFPFRGFVSVEDLWDLTPALLDTVFKTLNAQAKTQQEESLLQVKSKETDELNQKIEIVKYIVAVKLVEAAAKKEAADKKLKKQRILEALSEKENDELHSKSADELRKMLEEV